MWKFVTILPSLGLAGGASRRAVAIADAVISTSRAAPLSPLRTYSSIPASCPTSLIHPHSFHGASHGRLIPVRALASSAIPGDDAASEKVGFGGRVSGGDLPTGEFELVEFSWWRKFVVKLRTLFALPWERVKKGSVLTMKLRGEISDQLQSRFDSGLSLPQICENFRKATYDPRISGVYIHIEPLSCGWAKIEEIRRHIVDFKKSGKFIISYIPVCREREYYLACACEEIFVPPSAYICLYGSTVQASFLRGVLENFGIEPEIERIGSYKSAGDQLLRKTISKEMHETLTTLLNNIYGNWLDTVASSQGKEKNDIEDFINRGVYQVEKLKDESWVTGLLYDDEVISMLKARLGQVKNKNLLVVDDRKYSRVRKWTLGLEGKGDQIAVLRASGGISRARGSVSRSGIVAEKLIKKIRNIRDSDKYKAVILRIDSPGGDALASDLIWREIKLLSASKPVIASLSDVAASGGYYIAMAAEAVVADKLTLTGSIGVVLGKFNLQKLYERIGFNKELLSRGRYAELFSEIRPFRADEADLFKKLAQNIYEQFRDKAASSRLMSVEEMEKVAQGRVWSGMDAASNGLVDAIGGFERAIAIAKHKAKIPHDKQVRLVELSRPSPTLPEMFTSIWSSLFNLDQSVKKALQGLTHSGEVQARVDGIMFEHILGSPESRHPILGLIKDCVRDVT